jgi:hypothetical protein
MFLRRFDLEHTFRSLKQTLGWTKPRIRTPAAADRWTWPAIAAHTQPRLARHLVEDLRRPWEKTPTKSGPLSPARIRRGFRTIRPATAMPANAPKPSRPGPGRPPGSRNAQRAPDTTPAKPSKQTQRSRVERSKQLKTQAKSVSHLVMIDELSRRLVPDELCAR